jgi:hypothetical protein
VSPRLLARDFAIEAACSFPVIPPDIPPVIRLLSAFFPPVIFATGEAFQFCNSFVSRSTFPPLERPNDSTELRRGARCIPDTVRFAHSIVTHVSTVVKK